MNHQTQVDPNAARVDLQGSQTGNGHRQQTQHRGQGNNQDPITRPDNRGRRQTRRNPGNRQGVSKEQEQVQQGSKT